MYADEEERKRRSAARGWIRERRKAYDEEVARRDPAAAEVVQGYRRRVQDAEAKGVTRQSEYQAASEYARTHGSISARYVRDAHGNVNTVYAWSGKTADGREGSTDLVTVRGRHSVGDYNNRYNRLEVVSSNVDPGSEGFNNTMKFLFGKGSVYALTDQEKRGFRAVREAKHDLFVSDWAPKGGWGEQAGGKLTNKEVVAASSEARPTAGDGVASGEDRSVFSRDDSWLGGKKVEELGRRERLLYSIGVSKKEWDAADRAGKKAILEKQIYGSGTGTVKFDEARRHVAGFYKDRAADLGVSQAAADAESLRESRRRGAESLLGKDFMGGLTAKERERAEVLYGGTVTAGGRTLNQSISDAAGREGSARRAADSMNDKAALWSDTARLWSNRQKVLAETRRKRKEDIYG